MSFAQIYTGCKCPGGETWHVGIHEEVDTERDEVYTIPYCTICNYHGIDLKKKVTEKGALCLHTLTSEEIQAEMLFAEEFDDDFDDDDYDDNEWDFDDDDIEGY